MARRQFYLGLGALGLVGAAVLLYAALHRAARTAPLAARAVDPRLAAEATGHTRGRADAPVKLVEFADFECPGCAQFATVTEPDITQRLVETGLANFTFYDFPLPQHRNSYPASHAAMCAEAQGKFWEMHDRLFAGQNEWNTQATSNPTPIFQGYARAIGLDAAAWEQCYRAETHLRRIQANKARGDERGIHSTPSLFVNDQEANVAGYDQLKALVDSARAAAAPWRQP